MRALQFERLGGVLEVLRYRSVDVPRLAPDEVMIEVHAVAASTFDVAQVTGLYSYFYKKKLPATIGAEVSGVVAQVGENVTNFDIGAQVVATFLPGSKSGGFAEFVAVPERLVRYKPRTWSFASAALLPVSLRTMFQSLVTTVGIQTGYKVLIHGASTGLGIIAVQLCKAFQCVLAATCTPEQKPYLSQVGVDVLIDTSTEDFRTFIKHYDVVLHLEDGQKNLKDSVFCLKKGGVLLSISGPVDAEQNYLWNVPIYKKITNKIRFVSFFRLLRQQQVHYRFILPPLEENTFDEVMTFAEQTNIKPFIEYEYTFEKSIEALEYVFRKKNMGNIVVLVKQ